ncbi:MAG: succinylglutamate desuccinylase/aspartoacylase family protein [Pseudomonadota bacterium]|nr:MAG: succinylglutamate desuccinylase/aspartoacylase family protein [Pseudomonadota bacterium]
MLSIYDDQLPEGLLDCPAQRLHEVLPGPALIHLSGRRAAPLFISVLLHGNEPTGWEAVRALLSSHAGGTLPRALSLFIGNVAAAREGRRHLDGQPDYNRIWKVNGARAEHAMVREVLEVMRARAPFASIDIHNNTGRNPHYACINRLDARFQHLATLFSRTVVYFLKPDSVLSMAFAGLCPSVTVECGKPGEPYGAAHALEFLKAALNLAELPQHSVAAHDIDLFHTVAVVKVPVHLSVGFGAAESDVVLAGDIDELNFRELPAGTRLGWTSRPDCDALQAWSEDGVDLGTRYFACREGEIRTRTPLMPSMLTLDAQIIREDCLCYLMERLDAPAAP